MEPSLQSGFSTYSPSVKSLRSTLSPARTLKNFTGSVAGTVTKAVKSAVSPSFRAEARNTRRQDAVDLEIQQAADRQVAYERQARRAEYQVMERIGPSAYAPRNMVVDGIHLVFALHDPEGKAKTKAIGFESVLSIRFLSDDATVLELDIKGKELELTFRNNVAGEKFCVQLRPHLRETAIGAEHLSRQRQLQFAHMKTGRHGVVRVPLDQQATQDQMTFPPRAEGTRRQFEPSDYKVHVSTRGYEGMVPSNGRAPSFAPQQIVHVAKKTVTMPISKAEDNVRAWVEEERVRHKEAEATTMGGSFAAFGGTYRNLKGKNQGALMDLHVVTERKDHFSSANYHIRAYKEINGIHPGVGLSHGEVLEAVSGQYGNRLERQRYNADQNREAGNWQIRERLWDKMMAEGRGHVITQVELDDLELEVAKEAEKYRLAQMEGELEKQLLSKRSAGQGAHDPEIVLCHPIAYQLPPHHQQRLKREERAERRLEAQRQRWNPPAAQAEEDVELPVEEVKVEKPSVGLGPRMVVYAGDTFANNGAGDGFPVYLCADTLTGAPEVDPYERPPWERSLYVVKQQLPAAPERLAWVPEWMDPPKPAPKYPRRYDICRVHADEVQATVERWEDHAKINANGIPAVLTDAGVGAELYEFDIEVSPRVAKARALPPMRIRMIAEDPVNDEDGPMRGSIVVENKLNPGALVASFTKEATVEASPELSTAPPPRPWSIQVTEKVPALLVLSAAIAVHDICLADGS